jgi:hypothetical protein
MLSSQAAVLRLDLLMCWIEWIPVEVEIMENLRFGRELCYGCGTPPTEREGVVCDTASISTS